MTLAPKVITAPVKEPVSVAEALQHLRVDELTNPTENAAQEAEIGRMIAAARFYLEQSTGRTIHETTLEITLDKFPLCPVRLPRATPLIAISSMKWKDTAGTETTITASDYIADTDSDPGQLVRAYGISWPSTTLFPSNPIRIRYRAGIPTTSPETECGAEIKLPMMLMVAGMWENRETETVTDMKTIESIVLRWGIEKYITELMIH